jgi:hypothetical protein
MRIYDKSYLVAAVKDDEYTSLSITYKALNKETSRLVNKPHIIYKHEHKWVVVGLNTRNTIKNRIH